MRQANKRIKRVEAKAFARSVTNEFENYVKLNKRVPPEVVGIVQQIEDYAELASRAVSPASRFLPASKNSFDQR